MRLQESEAKILPAPLGFLLLLVHQETQVDGPGRLEAGHVQPSDVRAGAAEELSEDSIGYVGGVVRRGHEPPELELDDVVDLLLGEFLHLKLIKSDA